MEYYVALYDYEATTASNLTLMQGETVLVLEKASNGWWNGEASQGTGWFPETYVGKRNSDMLPMGWQAHADDAGRIYYTNLITQESVWNKPTAAAFVIGSTKAPPPMPTATADDDDDTKPEGEDDEEGPISPDDTSNRADAFAMTPVGSKVTKIDGRDLAVNTNGRVTYVDNFWADNAAGSGFDVMVAKQKTGKDVLRDIADWMRERSAIEERYAKELARLGKLTLGDMEEGTTKEAWAAVKADVLKQAEGHVALAKELQEHVERPLLDYREQQKLKRKDTEITIAKDRKNMSGREAEIERTRKIHHQRMRDAETVEKAATKAMMNDKKEFTRPASRAFRASIQQLDTSAKNERRKAKAAGEEYQKAVDEYLVVRKVWEEDLKQAFEDYQDVEVKRIEFVRAVLENYLNSERSLRDKNIERPGPNGIVPTTQSLAVVKKSVDEMSTDKDVEIFVKNKGTGPRKPLTGSVDQYTK